MGEGVLKFVSLFCGCGGFDLGFVQAGFKCCGAFDIDPVAVEVHRKNLASPAQLCDLSNGELSVNSFKNIDVLVAGPPCQGFSTVGKRTLDDPRNHLLVRAGEIALIMKPLVFVVENVTGVISGKHKQYWDSLEQMMRMGGYKTKDLCCNAEKIGLAQTRKRRVLIAWRVNKDMNIELPETGEGMTLRRALEGLNEGMPDHDTRELPPDSRHAMIARKIKPGQKLCNVRGGSAAVHTWDIPEVFGKTTKDERAVLEALLKLRRRIRVREFGDADPVSARALVSELGGPVKDLLQSLEIKGYVRHVGEKYDLTNTFNGTFRRLQWDKPSPTVHTQFGNPRYFLHPEENRGLTVREAARIQGFPDSFVFLGNEQDQYRLVGNAVPPPMAYYLAAIVRDIILK
jgi:DNA (cytosine-5)-methyltransferase 1